MYKYYYLIWGISDEATSKEDADKRINIHGITCEKTIYGH